MLIETSIAVAPANVEVTVIALPETVTVLCGMKDYFGELSTTDVESAVL